MKRVGINLLIATIVSIATNTTFADNSALMVEKAYREELMLDLKSNVIASVENGIYVEKITALEEISSVEDIYSDIDEVSGGYETGIYMGIEKAVRKITQQLNNSFDTIEESDLQL